MFDLSPPPIPSHDELRADTRRLHRVLIGVASFVVALAALWWAEGRFGLDLRAYSIHPRRPESLVGILTAPLLHGSLEHLLGNAFGLFLLGVLALYRYPHGSRIALPMIWLISGFGTWLIGRDSFHLGASGITHGLMFFVFGSGLIRRDRTAIAAAMLSFAFFGGMLLSVWPREPGVSWEYHLCGALGGLLAAFLVRKRDPAPPRRKYSWEIEAEAEGDPEWEAKRLASEFEPKRPESVSPIWRGPVRSPDTPPEPRRGVVVAFPGRGHRSVEHRE